MTHPDHPASEWQSWGSNVSNLKPVPLIPPDPNSDRWIISLLVLNACSPKDLYRKHRVAQARSSAQVPVLRLGTGAGTGQNTAQLPGFLEFTPDC